jgi:A/G-specific adenine glycosylase
MLQQTRIDVVIPYFKRFLERLPDVFALAMADDEVLLKLWEGLGYYRRALRMKEAARIIIDRYGGQIPDDPVALAGLPGVGPYAAGAIAAIAFGHPEPAVDGNVVRVVARLFGVAGEAGDPSLRRQVTDIVRAGIPANAAGDFAQALMELGALVCIPNGTPHCSACPVADVCAARRDNRIPEIPSRPVRKRRPVERMTVFVIRTEDGVVLERRAAEGILAGMWGLPTSKDTFDVPGAEAWLSRRGVRVVALRPLVSRAHVFTHVVWDMDAWLVDAASVPEDVGTVFTLAEIEREASVPTAFRPYLNMTSDASEGGK